MTNHVVLRILNRFSNGSYASPVHLPHLQKPWPPQRAEESVQDTPAPSSCVIIRRLKYPSPLCAPSHSPIAAPMMDSGTAILMAEKKQGSTAGIFNLKKIWRLSAPNVNSSSSISVFTDLNPSNTVIVIGKNVINTVTSTLLQMEYPNQSTNNGASAVVGIVCDAMISGYNAFSATSLTSIRIASPSPSTTEIKSPIATTDMVAGRCAVKSGYSQLP